MVMGFINAVLNQVLKFSSINLYLTKLAGRRTISHEKIQKVILSLFLFFFFLLCQNLPLISDSIERIDIFSHDLMVKLRLHDEPELDKKYVFIDINESSYKAWGEPFYTPRNKLAELINKLKETTARVIIVDIDLVKHGENEGNDKKLTNTLNSYSVKYPAIILMKQQERSGQLKELYFEKKLITQVISIMHHLNLRQIILIMLFEAGI